MKIVLGFLFTGLLLAITGCESGPGYGGGYVGVSGEYPTTYYGYGPTYGYAYPYHPYPYVVRPYDRDHYWDRHRYWERHRWHGDEHLYHDWH